MGFSYKSLFCFSFLFSIISPSIFANEPPRPGEIEYLKQTGQFEERLEAARAIGNHRIDPDLLNQAIYRTKPDALLQQGINPNEILPAPPASWSGMPTKGNVKMFALLIDFLDYPRYNTRNQIHSGLFGDGSLIPSNAFPYESLKNYYLRSSYGQLDLSSGMTLGWYSAPYNRSSVPMTPAGREGLIKAAISSLGDSVDFSQFDNDGNGEIDNFIVIWSGPNNGWSNFWWGYQTSFGDSSYTLNGKRLGKYSWQWEGYYGAYGPFNPITVIHETGHSLGLPDLYDYDSSIGPNGGVGDLDMMDGNWGDHNCFSKWVLDWLTPTVVNSGSHILALNPSETSADAVLIMPWATSSNPFSEFFIAQNRYRSGNDLDYPADGMLIWHVDATLNSYGDDYRYDNSYTAHKLVKLMEADGLERIEASSARADAAMYYKPGKTFGSTTTPSSKDYQGVFSRANVANILQNQSQMTATFSIEGGYILTVLKNGVGNGLVTSDKSGISCGNDCVESYPNGDVITLTAAGMAGSEFSGWSGGGCSGAGSCIVTLTSDTTVTATFASTFVLDEDFDPESSSPPVGWTPVTNSGNAIWQFTVDSIDIIGGTGKCAYGVSWGSNSYNDTELRTPAMNLAYSGSVGLEFKSGPLYAGVTADVDVSLNGFSGPWTNVWRKAVASTEESQTHNIDLTSAVAGSSNVMLRFHVYGTPNVLWVLDDIRVMVAAPIGSPGVFGRIGPSNGVTGQATGLTLNWGSSSGAASYEYCYTTDNCSGKWISAGSHTSAVINGLSFGANYYWHVRAINPAGMTNADAGTVWSFITKVKSPTGIISTVAGNEFSGYSGDGGQATAANLRNPYRVAVDSAGNVYIADMDNHRIRKVAPTGIISSVAGNGIFGYSGDGGLATEAQIFRPEGVAVDSGGNLYISDNGNNRIRKITAAGIISTVAGNGTSGYSGDEGLATEAQLDSPGSVEVDSAGNLYVADTQNHRIRKVTPAGIISTVAGNGSALYNGDGMLATTAALFASDVAVDSAGNLYIADDGNHRIRKVTPAGIISTAAGNGTSGYSGDGGLATAAQLYNPSGVAADSAGNLFIAEYLNHRVRKVTPTGIISTEAGNGSGGYGGDGGMAIAAQLQNPMDVAVDGAGNLYIADFQNHRIRKVRIPRPSWDSDADGKNDIAVWRPDSGIWYTLPSNSPGTYTGIQWGLSTDQPVPGDYDGDGKTDPAIRRQGTGVWYALLSDTPGSYVSTQWGISSDIPVPGDYDGDLKTDFAVWRPATGVWYVLLSSMPGSYTSTPWGQDTDIPMPGDYDADGKVDVAVWRPSSGVWYILPSKSPGTFISTRWGIASDIPVPGDYDGDSKTDLAVWRPGSGVWYILPSASAGSYTAIQWGLQTDKPSTGDFDNDGKADIAVWRPDSGTWYILSSKSPGSYTATQWGMATDVPISSVTGILRSVP